MSNGFYKVPIAVNEPVKQYAQGSNERAELLSEYKRMYNTTVDIPMYIGDKKVFSKATRNLTPPHDHKHVIGTSNYGSEKEVREADEKDPECCGRYKVFKVAMRSEAKNTMSCLWLRKWKGKEVKSRLVVRGFLDPQKNMVARDSSTATKTDSKQTVPRKNA